jgi:ElaB/YqjD/DUF883 family membrane-anchored ribosome-binding protein
LAATEPQRLALHAAARAALGAEEGDTLMALTPPANTDMATMQALERTEERLGARMTALGERLDARMTALEERLDARMTALEERLDARMTALEERLGARIDRSEERSRTHTWKVVVGTGVGLYLATVTTVLGGFALLS